MAVQSDGRLVGQPSHFGIETTDDGLGSVELVLPRTFDRRGMSARGLTHRTGDRGEDYADNEYK